MLCLHASVARLGVIGVLTMLLVGCGGNEHESTAAEMVQTLSELNQILEGVTDKASAEKAVPQLEGIATRIQDLQAQTEGFGDPPAEVQEAIDAKYREPLEQAMGQMLGHYARISADPEISGVLLPIFSGLTPE